MRILAQNWPGSNGCGVTILFFTEKTPGDTSTGVFWRNTGSGQRLGGAVEYRQHRAETLGIWRFSRPLPSLTFSNRKNTLWGLYHEVLYV